jgi:hypothetical protein
MSKSKPKEWGCQMCGTWNFPVKLITQELSDPKYCYNCGAARP